MSTIDSSSGLALQDYFSTTLSGAISASDTVIGLNAVPTGSEGFLVIDLGTSSQELIYYNTKSSNTVTCPSVARGRAVGGTTAVGHSSGASVKQVINSDFWKELQNGNANLGMQTYFNEGTRPYVASGCVWTADSAGASLNGSMTSGVVYVAGKRLVVASVSAHAFTASKDTYVDVTVTTGSNAGTLVFTEATNNAASPALAANSIRLAIVVTGVSNIAAAASINQGQPDRVLPIASSVAYSVVDSLGNLIYPTNPVPGEAGYRQIISNFTPGTIVETLITGLSMPVIVSTTPRKLRLTLEGAYFNTGSADNLVLKIKESATIIGAFKYRTAALNSPETNHFEVEVPAASLTAGTHTYTASISGGAANPAVEASATEICYLRADFV